MIYPPVSPSLLEKEGMLPVRSFFYRASELDEACLPCIYSKARPGPEMGDARRGVPETGRGPGAV